MKKSSCIDQKMEEECCSKLCGRGAVLMIFPRERNSHQHDRTMAGGSPPRSCRASMRNMPRFVYRVCGGGFL